ncbi:hypothetical protein RFA51_004157 [Vibrio fluvialis]|nr:hypothetical protein [Vibrio fluvialis]
MNRPLFLAYFIRHYLMNWYRTGKKLSHHEIQIIEQNFKRELPLLCLPYRQRTETITTKENTSHLKIRNNDQRQKAIFKINDVRFHGGCGGAMLFRNNSRDLEIEAENITAKNMTSVIEIEDSGLKENRMALKVKKGNYSNIKKLYRGPHTAEAEFDDPTVTNAETVFDIYIPESDLIAHGLPRDIPQDQLKDILTKISEQNGKDQDKLIDIINAHPLTKWMGFAANTLTLASPFVLNLIKLSSSS